MIHIPFSDNGTHKYPLVPTDNLLSKILLMTVLRNSSYGI